MGENGIKGAGVKHEGSLNGWTKKRQGQVKRKKREKREKRERGREEREGREKREER